MSKYDKQNKELVDRGWEEMSLLLDEAMPVKKGYSAKKYLFLLLLLILAGGGVYFTVDSHYGRQDSEYESIEEYTKIDTKKANTDQNNKSQISEIEEEIGSSISNTEQDANGNENFLKTRQIRIQKQNNNNKNSRLKNYESIENSVQVNHNDQELALINTDETIAGIEQKEKNKLFKLTQHIATKQLFVRTYTNPLNIDRVFMAFVKSPCTDYLYETDLNVVSENLKSIGGFEIGVNRNFALMDNFYISSGLQYSFYKKYRTNTSFFKTYMQSGDFGKPYGDNKGSVTSFNNNFRSPQVLSNFIDELHYLSIPVTVNYKTSRITYSIGLRVSYMIYGENYIADKQRFLDYNVIINSKDVFYNGDIFNKVDYSFTFGVSYSLSQKLYVSAKANYSYVGIINSDNISQGRYTRQYTLARDIQLRGRFDKNVYFALGFKYRFGKSCRFL